jgi:hypothetical protein
VRLLLPFALVLSMSGSEIERAQQVARGRDSERQQFHQRYVFDLKNDTVTQIEVITEFRRLVLISEEHVFRGDWLFTRSVRSGEQALAPTRGLTTIRATVRFNPLNTFIAPPAYLLAMSTGAPGGVPSVLETTVTPQFSVPYKARTGKMVSSMVGATLEANVHSTQLGQLTHMLTVILDGREIARATVEFGKLD